MNGPRKYGFVEAAKIGYFAPVARWPAVERRALRWVRGRVLDAGVGAGRAALELQRRGRKVVAIDVSAGAVDVARGRGVRDVRLLAFEEVDESLGRFDTIVMFGNNFGLFGDARKARARLRRLYRVTNGLGRILAGSADPHRSQKPDHFLYVERNRERGRMTGQVRFRVRHRRAATPYFDFLFVSSAEMHDLAARAGWQLVRALNGENGYVGVLEKA